MLSFKIHGDEKKRAFDKNVTDLQGVPEKTLFCVQRPKLKFTKKFQNKFTFTFPFLINILYFCIYM